MLKNRDRLGLGLRFGKVTSHIDSIISPITITECIFVMTLKHFYILVQVYDVCFTYSYICFQCIKVSLRLNVIPAQKWLHRKLIFQLQSYLIKWKTKKNRHSLSIPNLNKNAHLCSQIFAWVCTLPYSYKGIQYIIKAVDIDWWKLCIILLTHVCG